MRKSAVKLIPFRINTNRCQRVYRSGEKSLYLRLPAQCSAASPVSESGHLHDTRRRNCDRQNITRNWTIFGGMTLLDPSIDNLPYTPKRAVTAGINGQMGPFRLTVDTQYQSSVLALNRPRAAGAVNTEQVDSFVIMNARVSHRLPHSWQKRRNFRGHGKSSGCQLCLSPRLSHAGPLGADRLIGKLLIETDMAE